MVAFIFLKNKPPCRKVNFKKDPPYENFASTHEKNASTQ